MSDRLQPTVDGSPKNAGRAEAMDLTWAARAPDLASGGLCALLRRQGAINRDKVALQAESTLGVQTITYGRLAELVDSMTESLRRIGLGAGDSIALWMDNRPQWLVTYFAAAALRCAVVPINIYSTVTEAAEMINECGCMIVIIDDPALRSVEQLERLAGGRPILSINGSNSFDEEVHFTWETDVTDIVPRDAESARAGAADDGFLESILTYYFSSGTTGRPKAAIHTQSNVIYNAVQQLVDMDIRPDDLYVATGSFSWAGGLHTLTLPILLSGGTIVLPVLGGMTPERVTKEYVRARATVSVLIPSLLRQVLASEEATGNLRQSRVRFILSGGEPLQPWLSEECGELLPGIPLLRAYGFSEFPTVASIQTPEDVRTHPDTAGRPGCLTQFAVEKDGVVMPSGDGELVVRSPALARGYLDRPDETEVAFRGGWFHTGDLGNISESGHISISGRSKEIIISGGLNISPQEIENFIASAVGREAVVVGVPDDRFGERLVAVVSTEGETDAHVVKDACRSGLSGYKVPTQVLLWTGDLPRSVNGKLLRDRMRKWAVEKATELS